jgi:hypothetical protein
VREGLAFEHDFCVGKLRPIPTEITTANPTYERVGGDSRAATSFDFADENAAKVDVTTICEIAITDAIDNGTSASVDHDPLVEPSDEIDDCALADVHPVRLAFHNNVARPSEVKNLPVSFDSHTATLQGSGRPDY